MGDSSNLDGAFLGDVDGQQAAADMRVEVDGRGVRWTIRRLGGDGQCAHIESADPKVRWFQREVHQAFRREAMRARPVTTNFKERTGHKVRPAPVPCPACSGIEPEVWDCETCKGGGSVPG